MTKKKALQLGFCLLVLAALAGLTPAVQAFDFSYSQTAIGGSPTQACNNAVQKIEDYCDRHGPITTDPGGCKPLWGPDGSVIGWVCSCTATATYCQIFAGPQL